MTDFESRSSGVRNDSFFNCTITTFQSALIDHSRPLFYFRLFYTLSRKLKFPMTDFESGSSSVRSDRSFSYDTTTFQSAFIVMLDHSAIFYGRVGTLSGSKVSSFDNICSISFIISNSGIP